MLSPAAIRAIAAETPRRAEAITFLSARLALDRDFVTNRIAGVSQETLAADLDVSRPSLRGYLRVLKPYGLGRRRHTPRRFDRPAAPLKGWSQQPDTYKPGWIDDPGVVVPLVRRVHRPLRVPVSWVLDVLEDPNRAAGMRRFYQRVLDRLQEGVENPPSSCHEPFQHGSDEPFPPRSSRTVVPPGCTAATTAAAPVVENTATEPGLPFGPIGVVYVDRFDGPTVDEEAEKGEAEPVVAANGGLYAQFDDRDTVCPDLPNLPTPTPSIAETRAEAVLRRFTAVHDELGFRRFQRHDGTLTNAATFARRVDPDDWHDLWLQYFGWPTCRDDTRSFDVFFHSLDRHQERLARARLADAERRQAAEARRRWLDARAPAPVIPQALAVALCDRLGVGPKSMTSSAPDTHVARVLTQRDAIQTASRPPTRRARVEQTLTQIFAPQPRDADRERLAQELAEIARATGEDRL
jgi:hypothetical protein